MQVPLVQQVDGGGDADVVEVEVVVLVWTLEVVGVNALSNLCYVRTIINQQSNNGIPAL